MSIHDLLQRLWDDYAAINPQAQAIHNLLEAQNERVINDHIAFRTFDDPRVNIDVLAHRFLQAGYRLGDHYTFTDKHLSARHYEHDDPTLPKVFISQLQSEHFSPELRATIEQLLGQVDDRLFHSDDLICCGRPWELGLEQYSALLDESEYAGWLAAFGFRANHFTVLVNELRTVNSLQELNQLLESAGFKLNAAGGKIKGSPEVFLEQSSTLAAPVQVRFSNTVATVPGCYYEFARRYRLPNGQLFQGFVAKSADRIFESTDRKAMGM